MATALYHQPAAANYFTPPPHQSRQRGYRICDQCGAAENPQIQKFRLCGGCMVTQYCSQDCQRANWLTHKAICQHTSAQLSAVKQTLGSEYGGENDLVTKELRKFASMHQSMLGWVGFQALQLRRVPANIRQKALLIELAPIKSSNPNCRFNISRTHIVNQTFVNQADPLAAVEIARRDERCRRVGGLGAAVVMLQCRGVNMVIPFEVDAPNTITWDDRSDWEKTLQHFVDSGRSDFKPISTSAKGIRYG